ncbi:hypothetical protein [Pseudoruegeria sp. HB172150]|uniref:hypothetical protein n=1 Tax=Pseudoruegeria sp. HB172150 TaxID=2721164 RepID=UPI0015569717|nr:hypothetical protein [Pseudoruegeria sp. HB172150]
MKKLLVAAAALAVATPVLANDQLALSLGVQPGEYSLEQLAVLKSVEGKTGNDALVNLDNLENVSSRGIVNPVATAQFQELADE